MKPIKTIISWSSGKDSTLTLIKLLNDPKFEVVGLFTTHLEKEVPFQATPVEVVSEQARLAGLPLILISLPEVFPPNEVYQSLVVDGLRDSKVVFDAVAFGDMFCNGIADYRRSYIEPAGWQCVFPLLGCDSKELAQEIIESGIRTRVITVDTSQLDGSYCGQWYTTEFISSLPKSVDHCGENGEFHTLVIEAPCFSGKLLIKPKGIERQDRFHYQRYQLMN